MNNQKAIYTIGHSTRSMAEFLGIIQSFNIELVADIRRYPGSKRHPHFSRENIEASLKQNNINYLNLNDLGGRRKPRPDSVNTAWRLEAFKGYADYMETETFKKAAAELERLALNAKTVYMCSEAVWWSCHRALLSDYLKARGWTVLHIMKKGQSEVHPYTKPAQIIDGHLSYRKPDLFNL